MGSTGQVKVPGASCRPGPSPSSKATRLDGLSAESPAALEALIAAVGTGPVDFACPPDDPLVPILGAAGFTPYATTVVMARRIDGYRKQPAPSGVKIEPYRNDWAEAFTTAEASAMQISSGTSAGTRGRTRNTVAGLTSPSRRGRSSAAAWCAR